MLYIASNGGPAGASLVCLFVYFFVLGPFACVHAVVSGCTFVGCCSFDEATNTLEVLKLIR